MQEKALKNTKGAALVNTQVMQLHDRGTQPERSGQTEPATVGSLSPSRTHASPSLSDSAKAERGQEGAEDKFETDTGCCFKRSKDHKPAGRSS